MLRVTLTAIVTIGLSSVLAAQARAPERATAPVLPPIGLPLPPIGLPLPPIGLPAAVDAQPNITGGRPTGPRDQGRRRAGDRRERSGPTFVYLGPAYPWGYEAALYASPTMTFLPGTSMPGMVDVRTGGLQLEVEPAVTLQIYVDGRFVGTPADFSRGDLQLEAGPHHIELYAPGYEPLEFHTTIAAGRLITYRGVLQPIASDRPRDPVVRSEPERRQPPPEAPTPAPRTTIYFIPGCYLGNLPPADVSLPAGCDLSRLITRKP